MLRLQLEAMRIGPRLCLDFDRLFQSAIGYLQLICRKGFGHTHIHARLNTLSLLREPLGGTFFETISYGSRPLTATAAGDNRFCFVGNGIAMSPQAMSPARNASVALP